MTVRIGDLALAEGAVTAPRTTMPGPEAVPTRQVLAGWRGGPPWMGARPAAARDEDPSRAIVRQVDGREVRSLADLARHAERADGGPFVVFGLGEGGRVTVDRARAASLAQRGAAGGTGEPVAVAGLGGGK